jgi:hypothetical protein
MKKRTAQEQKLADRAYLARAWRNWHRDLLAEALAGVHHDVLERLLAQLKDLHSARALVALISDIDWSVVDRDTRAIALHEISQMIMQVREKSGLPPIDGPLPGQPDNAFRIIKAMFENFPPSAGEPAGGKAR